MPFLELFDETLDINSTGNYDLSVQTGPYALSYCILDTIRNKYVMLRSFEAENNSTFKISETEDIISKDDFLTKHYRKTYLIIPSRKFTLIPTQLFDPGRKDEYFAFNHVADEGDIVLFNKNPYPDAYTVFSVPGQFSRMLNEKFPGSVIMHHLKPLLNHIGHQSKSPGKNYIHLNIEKDYFDLAICTNEQIIFCNTFIYRNINDILYYVLNTFKKLDIPQEETIWLSGYTEKYDDLSSAFSIYIRHLRYPEPSGNFTFSYVFNDTVLHRFLNLFTAVTCE